MGVIFTKENSKRITIREIINEPWANRVLGRLQAGRIVDKNGSVPYRLTAADLQKVIDEDILVSIQPDCIYATFVKPVTEICQILGKPEVESNLDTLFMDYIPR